MSEEEKLPTGYYSFDNESEEARRLKSQLSTLTAERDELRKALRGIKLWCLTTKVDGGYALAHIVRLCLNAGITEKLPELQAIDAAMRKEGK